LYISAIGGSSRGILRGFGSVLDPKLPTATKRARATQSQSSVSGLTTTESQKTYTEEEMNAILVQDRDHRLNEEREERLKVQEEYNVMFGQLFAMVGGQRPNLQVRYGIIFNISLRNCFALLVVLLIVLHFSCHA